VDSKCSVPPQLTTSYTSASVPPQLTASYTSGSIPPLLTTAGGVPTQLTTSYTSISSSSLESGKPRGGPNLRILFQYLERVDKETLQLVKDVVKECERKYLANDTKFDTLHEAINENVRNTIGEMHWVNACKTQALLMRSIQQKTHAKATGGVVPMEEETTAPTAQCQDADYFSIPTRQRSSWRAHRTKKRRGEGRPLHNSFNSSSASGKNRHSLRSSSSEIVRSPDKILDMVIEFEGIDITKSPESESDIDMDE